MEQHERKQHSSFYKLRQQELDEQRERITNGYARVSRDGEVYLDFNDRRTQNAAKALIEKFAELAE